MRRIFAGAEHDTGGHRPHEARMTIRRVGAPSNLP
jgi:hypothetical protein